MLRSTKKVKISIKKNKTTCTFKSVERENEGTYTCKATSESGTVETKATLFCHELSEEERTKLEERKQKEERKKRKDQERRAAAEAAKENARMLAKKTVEDAEKERKRKQEERKMLEQRKKEERILEEKKREEERLATQQLKLKKTPTARKVVEVTKEETDEFVKTKHVLKKTQEIQQKVSVEKTEDIIQHEASLEKAKSITHKKSLTEVKSLPTQVVNAPNQDASELVEETLSEISTKIEMNKAEIVEDVKQELQATIERTETRNMAEYSANESRTEDTSILSLSQTQKEFTRSRIVDSSLQQAQTTSVTYTQNESTETKVGAIETVEDVAIYQRTRKAKKEPARGRKKTKAGSRNKHTEGDAGVTIEEVSTIINTENIPKTAKEVQTENRLTHEEVQKVLVENAPLDNVQALDLESSSAFSVDTSVQHLEEKYVGGETFDRAVQQKNIIGNVPKVSDMAFEETSSINLQFTKSSATENIVSKNVSRISVSKVQVTGAPKEGLSDIPLEEVKTITQTLNLETAARTAVDRDMTKAEVKTVMIAKAPREELGDVKIEEVEDILQSITEKTTVDTILDRTELITAKLKKILIAKAPKIDLANVTLEEVQDILGISTTEVSALSSELDKLKKAEMNLVQVANAPCVSSTDNNEEEVHDIVQKAEKSLTVDINESKSLLKAEVKSVCITNAPRMDESTIKVEEAEKFTTDSTISKSADIVETDILKKVAIKKVQVTNAPRLNETNLITEEAEKYTPQTEISMSANLSEVDLFGTVDVRKPQVANAPRVDETKLIVEEIKDFTSISQLTTSADVSETDQFNTVAIKKPQVANAPRIDETRLTIEEIKDFTSITQLTTSADVSETDRFGTVNVRKPQIANAPRVDETNLTMEEIKDFTSITQLTTSADISETDRFDTVDVRKTQVANAPRVDETKLIVEELKDFTSITQLTTSADVSETDRFNTVDVRKTQVANAPRIDETRLTIEEIKDFTSITQLTTSADVSETDRFGTVDVRKPQIANAPRVDETNLTMEEIKDFTSITQLTTSADISETDRFNIVDIKKTQVANAPRVDETNLITEEIKDFTSITQLTTSADVRETENFKTADVKKLQVANVPRLDTSVIDVEEAQNILLKETDKSQANISTYTQSYERVTIEGARSANAPRVEQSTVDAEEVHLLQDIITNKKKAAISSVEIEELETIMGADKIQVALAPLEEQSDVIVEEAQPLTAEKNKFEKIDATEIGQKLMKASVHSTTTHESHEEIRDSTLRWSAKGEIEVESSSVVQKVEKKKKKKTLVKPQRPILEENISENQYVEEMLDYLGVNEFEPVAYDSLQDLAKISFRTKHGISSEEITAQFEAGHFPALCRPEAQMAMVQLVERQGYGALIAEVVAEETTSEERLAATGFRALMKVYEQSLADIDEVITHFTPEDFMWDVAAKSEVKSHKQSSKSHKTVTFAQTAETIQEIGTMSLEKVQLKKVHAEETETEEFGKASQIEVHVKEGKKKKSRGRQMELQGETEVNKSKLEMVKGKVRFDIFEDQDTLSVTKTTSLEPLRYSTTTEEVEVKEKPVSTDTVVPVDRRSDDETDTIPSDHKPVENKEAIKKKKTTRKTLKKSQEKGLVTYDEDTPDFGVEAEDTVVEPSEIQAQELSTVSETLVTTQQNVMEAPKPKSTKPKLVKGEMVQIEQKQVRAKKFEVHNVEETPLFTQIKLKKASIVKREIEVQELPKVMLKGVQQTVNYNPTEQIPIIHELQPVPIQQAILSRNTKEALKIMKKKVRKLSIENVESELEKYDYERPELEKYEKLIDETATQYRRKEKSTIETAPEQTSIIIRKGKKIEASEEESETIRLKPVVKDEVDSEKDVQYVLKKVPEKVKEITEQSPVKKVEVLEPLKFTPIEHTSEDLQPLPSVPEKIKKKKEKVIVPDLPVEPLKVDEEEEPIKSTYERSPKPILETEEPTVHIIKGKPKKSLPEDQPDITLKYKQKPKPDDEPEIIQLKPFQKDISDSKTNTESEVGDSFTLPVIKPSAPKKEKIIRDKKFKSPQIPLESVEQETDDTYETISLFPNLVYKTEQAIESECERHHRVSISKTNIEKGKVILFKECKAIENNLKTKLLETLIIPDFELPDDVVPKMSVAEFCKCIADIRITNISHCIDEVKIIPVEKKASILVAGHDVSKCTDLEPFIYVQKKANVTEVQDLVNQSHISQLVESLVHVPEEAEHMHAEIRNINFTSEEVVPCKSDTTQENLLTEKFVDDHMQKIYVFTPMVINAEIRNSATLSENQSLEIDISKPKREAAIETTEDLEHSIELLPKVESVVTNKIPVHEEEKTSFVASMKKQPEPTIENVDISISKPKSTEVQQEPEDVEQRVSIKKRTSKKKSVTEDEEIIEMKIRVPQDEQTEEVMVLKKTISVAPEEESVEIKISKPKQVDVEELTENVEQSVSFRTKPKEKKPVSEDVEELEIKIPVHMDEPSEEVTILKKATVPVSEEECDEICISKPKPVEVQKEPEDIEQNVSIKRKVIPKKSVPEEAEVIEMKIPIPKEEQAEEITLFKKKTILVPEDESVEISISKPKPVEVQQEPEEVEQKLIIKKKPKKTSVTDEAEVLEIIIPAPQEEQTEEVTILKKKPAPVSEDESVEISMSKPKPVEVQQEPEEVEQIVSIKKKPKKKTSVTEEAEVLEIKLPAPQEDQTEEITILKKKTVPVHEDESVEISISKPKAVEGQQETEEVEQKVSIKKKLRKKTSVTEEAEVLAIKLPAPQENETEEITILKKKTVPLHEDESVEINISKPKPVEVQQETEEVEQKVSIKKKPRKKTSVTEEAEVLEIKIPAPQEEQTEEVTILKKKSVPVPEDESVEFSISKPKPVEVQQEPEEVEQRVSIKKKPKKKTSVTEEAEVLEIKLSAPQEDQTEEITILKKRPVPVHEDESVEISISKPKPVEVQQETEEVERKVSIKKKPKKKTSVTEEAEVLEIKLPAPQEDQTEEITILKKKPVPVHEDESVEISISKPKPVEIQQETEEVEQKVSIKKKPRKKTSVTEEAEVLEIKIPAPQEEQTEEVTILKKKSVPVIEEENVEVSFTKPKPKIPLEEIEEIQQNISIKRKPKKLQTTEEFSEEITISKLKPEDKPESPTVETVTFKPKPKLSKQEIEQEFKIHSKTYEEEEINLSKSVKLKRKKKTSYAEETGEGTIRIVQEYDNQEEPHVEIIEIDDNEDETDDITSECVVEDEDQEPQEMREDVQLKLGRKKTPKVYSIENTEEEEIQVGFKVRKEIEKRLDYGEDSLQLKVNRKQKKKTAAVTHEEEASLSITQQLETEESHAVLTEIHEGDKMYAVCSYVAENQEALNLVEGERVYILECHNSDWWFVKKHLTEEKGWAPAQMLKTEVKYSEYVQKKLHEKIDKLPVFEKPSPGEPVSAPRFIEKLQPKHSPDGGTITFECRVDGSPRPLITWFRQTAIIKPSPDFQIFYDENNVATLLIKEVFPEDAGMFTCVAKNAAGFASSTTELIVEAPLSDHGSEQTGGHSRKSLSRESSLADILDGIPPTFAQKPRTRTVDEGQSVVLECRLVAIPEPELQWFYNGRELRESRDVIISMDSDMHSYTTLVKINKVQKSHEGTYEVLARNREGHATNKVGLKVITGAKEPPQILEPLKSVVVSEGDSVVLTTQILANPQPRVTWYRNGVELKPDGKNSVTKLDKDVYSLIVYHTTLSDDGDYMVSAENEVGSAQTSAILCVEELLELKPEPPMFVERFEEQHVQSKGVIRLEAKVTGNPQPEIAWFRNNKRLKPSKHIKEIYDGESIVLEIECGEDGMEEGDYKCVATNSVGKASHGALVTVEADKIKFTKKLQNIEVEEGNDAKLECHTSQSVTTKWFYNNKEITTKTSKYEIITELKKHVLIIKNTKQTDAGLYKCTAKDQSTQANLTIRESGVEFVRKLVDFEVKERELAILEVEVSSPTAEVSWHKDGEELKEGDDRFLFEKEGTVRKLLIRYTSVHDEGEYTCALGEQECTAEVTIVELPPEIIHKMQDVTIAKGERATFEIELTKGDALVRWFKDGAELQFSEHVQLAIDGKRQRLMVYNATLEDAGEYSCQVGEQTSVANLLVEEPAVEFITRLPDVTLTPQNTDAMFTVELSQPDVEVTWLRNGKPVKPSDRHDVYVEKTIRKLVVKKVSMDDQAEYTCVAVNVKTSSKLKIEIIETAPRINMDVFQKDYRVRKGEDVNITVKYSAIPKPKDEWFVNGNVLKKSKKITQSIDEASASLTIQKVQEEDCGSLTLRLTNNCGEASAELNLIIMKTPSQPGTPEVIEITNETVTLHWKAPESDGNTKITQYILEYHDKVDVLSWTKITETITETTHKVCGLKHNMEYMFRVTAVNEVGPSPPSSTTRYIRITEPVNAEPPVIQEPLTDTVSGLGVPVTLQCVIGGIPEPDIKWLRDGKPFKTKTMTYENRIAKFTITQISETSGATFTCQATNEAGVAETTGKLIVQEKPRLDVADESMLAQKQRVNNQWKIEVKFAGFPKPTVSWSRDGRKIESTRQCSLYVDEESTTIAIYSLTREDSGVYTVTATNSAGSTSLDLHLRVIDDTVRMSKSRSPSQEPVDKPGRPEGPLVVKKIQKESVTIEWKPPADDGGLEISKYSVEKCDIQKMVWMKVADIEGTITSYAIQRLNEGSEYMFRVFAANPIGYSEALESDTIVVKSQYEPPSPPRGPLDITGMTDTSLTIKWQAPESDGGSHILEYLVERREVSKKAWQKVGSTSAEVTNIEVTSLKLNTSYHFRITARNEVGSSQPFAPEEAITVGKRITPPSKPTNLTVVDVTSRSVTLEWGPPASTGGTEITGYIIEKRISKSKTFEKVVTLEPSVTQYSIQNLKGKSEFYFRVYAENAMGLSEPAETKCVRLKTHASPPSPPTAPLETRGTGPNSIVIAWGIPESDGGAPIEGYTIAIKDTRKTMWMEVGRVKADVQKLNIRDLQEGHTYMLRIFARNEVGQSEPLESEEPVQVLRPADWLDVASREGDKDHDAPSLSLTTETTTSWMKEANMDADISTYARGCLLRKDEYFFKIWHNARKLFK